MVRYIDLVYCKKLIFLFKTKHLYIAPLTLMLPMALSKWSREWMFWMTGAFSFLDILLAGTKHCWYIAPSILMIAGFIAVSLSLLTE